MPEEAMYPPPEAKQKSSSPEKLSTLETVAEGTDLALYSEQAIQNWLDAHRKTNKEWATQPPDYHLWQAVASYMQRLSMDQLLARQSQPTEAFSRALVERNQRANGGRYVIRYEK